MHRFFVNVPARARLTIEVVIAVAIPLGVALALVPLRNDIPNATVALILAVLVALIATLGGRLTALVAASSAGLSFDIFHTRPFNSLTITRTQDVETTTLLLVVSVVVGQLAARNRRNRSLAAAANYNVGRIHGVAEMVAAGDPVDQVVLAAAYEIRDVLNLESCVFDAAFADPPGPFIERHGAVSWGSFRWGLDTMGLPGQEISLIIQHQGRPLGRYVLVAPPGTRVTSDQLLVAVALADQAGAALATQSQPA